MRLRTRKKKVEKVEQNMPIKRRKRVRSKRFKIF